MYNYYLTDITTPLMFNFFQLVKRTNELNTSIIFTLLSWGVSFSLNSIVKCLTSGMYVKCLFICTCKKGKVSVIVFVRRLHSFTRPTNLYKIGNIVIAGLSVTCTWRPYPQKADLCIGNKRQLRNSEVTHYFQKLPGMADLFFRESPATLFHVV